MNHIMMEMILIIDYGQQQNYIEPLEKKNTNEYFLNNYRNFERKHLKLKKMEHGWGNYGKSCFYVIT
mgnify:CR=1 FL=1